MCINIVQLKAVIQSHSCMSTLSDIHSTVLCVKIDPTNPNPNHSLYYL